MRLFIIKKIVQIFVCSLHGTKLSGPGIFKGTQKGTPIGAPNGVPKVFRLPYGN